MPFETRHVCRCGRSIPEDADGILKAHKVGKSHPGFPGISKAKRRVTDCTGPDKERLAATAAKEKAEKARQEAEAFAAKAAEDMKKAEELIALAKELEGEKPAAAADWRDNLRVGPVLEAETKPVTDWRDNVRIGPAPEVEMKPKALINEDAPAEGGFLG